MNISAVNNAYDETLEHDKKVLSEREDLIIRNMLISSIGLIATYGGYKKLETDM